MESPVASHTPCSRQIDFARITPASLAIASRSNSGPHYLARYKAHRANLIMRYRVVRDLRMAGLCSRGISDPTTTRLLCPRPRFSFYRRSFGLYIAFREIVSSFMYDLTSAFPSWGLTTFLVSQRCIFSCFYVYPMKFLFPVLKHHLRHFTWLTSSGITLWLFMVRTCASFRNRFTSGPFYGRMRIQVWSLAKYPALTRAGTCSRRGKGFAGVQLTLNTGRKIVIAEDGETWRTGEDCWTLGMRCFRFPVRCCISFAYAGNLTIAHVAVRNGTGSYLMLSIMLFKAIGPAKSNISRWDMMERGAILETAIFFEVFVNYESGIGVF